MRAREPDVSSTVERDGVRIAYEVHGDDHASTVLLLPTWSIVHARHWKMHVPELARHYRVVTFDGRGNGGSSRPRGADAYRPREFTQDALAVMDATSTDRAVMVGFSAGAQWLLELAVQHAERVAGAAFLAPALPLGTPPAGRAAVAFDERIEAPEGWQKYNRHHWLEHYEDFLWFFFGRCFSESHSTKGIEDAVSWALETDPATLVDTVAPTASPDAVLTREGAEAMARRVACPVLVIHGDEDGIRDHSSGAELAELTGGRLVTVAGGGHTSHVRHPVRVSLELRQFIDRIHGTPSPPRVWRRALHRPRRALYISSPIGLGHVQRDLAIVRELRALVPELEVDWWAQHPVTQVLEAAGERIHPESRRMASESRHWEEESAGHELHAFQAFRRMDEIFLANFMLFHDVVTHDPYDLWIGDESWEVDYHLHENPELKTAPYAFLTDVIGFLPVDGENDPREAEVVADYNAEMIEHRARYPRLRDLSLYVGDYDDLPAVPFGPGLPEIPAWSRAWFEAIGTIAPGGPAGRNGERTARRRELGYPDEGPLLFAAVGGTSIGLGLLRLVARAFELLRARCPGARMVMVTGPRLDPGQVPDVPGLERRGYVHDLHRHLACADLAVVQGGLSTTFELVAAGTPFLYFPLRKHWEQVHHVQCRLERYGAGRGLDFAATTPESLCEQMARTLERRPSYRPVAPGAARRAAERIATLVSR